MKARLLLVLIVLSTFLFSGCIATQGSKSRDAEINALKEQVASLQSRQQELEERFQGTAQKSAEAYLAMEQMQQDVAMMRGRFEESAHFSKQSENEAEHLRDFVGAQLTTVDKRLAVLEKKAGVKGAKELDSVPSAGALVADTNEKKSPEDLYKEAYTAFKQSNYEVAKAKFRFFLQKYPRNKLADEAQFNLAETFFKQKDYENAILEYDKVTAKYPGSKWSKAAYLNLGFSFLELGSKSDARLFFERVISDYPGTEEAKIAKKKLGMMR